MEFKKAFFIFIFVVFFFFIFYANLPKLGCFLSGGEWHSFPTNCVDYCWEDSGDDVFSFSFCGDQITNSCMCDFDQCSIIFFCISEKNWNILLNIFQSHYFDFS